MPFIDGDADFFATIEGRRTDHHASDAAHFDIFRCCRADRGRGSSQIALLILFHIIFAASTTFKKETAFVIRRH